MAIAVKKVVVHNSHLPKPAIILGRLHRRNLKDGSLDLKRAHRAIRGVEIHTDKGTIWARSSDFKDIPLSPILHPNSISHTFVDGPFFKQAVSLVNEAGTKKALKFAKDYNLQKKPFLILKV